MIKQYKMNRKDKKILAKVIEVVKQLEKEGYKEYDFNFPGEVVRRAGVKKLGSGCYRTTFAISKEWVIKVSISSSRHNEVEAELYAKDSRYKAQCWLVKADPKFLVMRRTYNHLQVTEAVKDASGDVVKEFTWLNDLVDGWQVGFLRRSKEIVCYDYAGYNGYGEQLS